MATGRWLILSVAAALASGCAVESVRASASQSGTQELTIRPDASTRLLIVAPHPDDEAIAAAGLVQRVRAAGGSVRVVLMTSGDAFPEGVKTERHIRRPEWRDYRAYGSERERETIDAMRRLDVDRRHVLLLGFPDGGLCMLASAYLSSKARAFESPYTGRVEPPSSEQVIRGTTYRGADIRRELESIVTAYQPTIVAFPHPDDGHPDHCATSIFMLEVIDAMSRGQPARMPLVLQYLVHYEPWPDLDESTSLPLQPPSTFAESEGTIRSLALTPTEANRKRSVLEIYRTQLLVIGRFVRAFGRPNELFIEGRTASPPECWCDGMHVATEVPPDRYRRKRGGRR